MTDLLHRCSSLHLCGTRWPERGSMPRASPKGQPIKLESSQQASALGHTAPSVVDLDSGFDATWQARSRPCRGFECAEMIRLDESSDSSVLSTGTREHCFYASICCC